MAEGMEFALAGVILGLWLVQFEKNECLGNVESEERRSASQDRLLNDS